MLLGGVLVGIGIYPEMSRERFVVQKHYVYKLKNENVTALSLSPFCLLQGLNSNLDWNTVLK